MHRALEAEPLDDAREPAAFLRLADHDQLAVALGAQLGQRLEQRDQALERHVRAGGHHDATGHPRYFGVRPEMGVVDADRHDVQFVLDTVHLADDVAGRRRRDGEDARQLRDDPHLHAQEPVPASQRDLSQRVAGVAELERLVDGDRMVERGHDRPPLRVQLEHAPAEALVVVDQVEVGPPVTQEAADPPAVRQRLREPGSAHDPELRQVDERLELVRPRDPEWVLRPVEIEARDRGERDVGVEVGIRLAAEHLDPVAEVGQLPREPAGVHALPTRVRIAPI